MIGKLNFVNKLINSLVVRRSLDDLAIPYLRPRNIPIMINPVDDIETYITSLIFIKTAGGLSIKPPAVLHGPNHWNKISPFWNSEKVKSFLWYRNLDKIKLNQAKIIIAREVMDYMYYLIYIRNAPIIAVRAVLVDWKTTKPVEPSILKDKWFSDTGFNHYIINTDRLKHWEIRTEFVEPDSGAILNYKYINDYEFKFIHLDEAQLNKLFTKYNINLDYIVNRAFVETNYRLNKISDNKIKNILQNKIYSVVKSHNFNRKVFDFILNKLQNNREFRDTFVTGNKQEIVNSIVYSIINTYIDQQIISL
jgi:hypothetical protein